MGLGLILTMGGLSVGSKIVAIILNKMGKVDDAAMVEVVTTTLMVSTVVTSVLSAFAKVRKLG